MKEKDRRMAELRKMLEEHEVSSQGEMVRLMLGRGFRLTQSTLSRDLRELKVNRTVTADGSYRYTLQPERRNGAQPAHDNGFVGISFSGNMAVVRTRPGYASRLAYEIDEKASADVIGTVAGEDTILLVIAEDSTREKVLRALSSFIEKLK